MTQRSFTVGTAKSLPANGTMLAMTTYSGIVKSSNKLDRGLVYYISLYEDVQSLTIGESIDIDLELFTTVVKTTSNGHTIRTLIPKDI